VRSKADPMISFCQIFAIPRGHSLVLLKHRVDRRGREEWRHEERDPMGRLIAYYESWEDLARQASGYRKLDPQGRLLSASHELPLP
jgi:hypothetical protein